MARADKKTKTAKGVDWSLAPRGVVSATVQGAAGLAAVAGVGEMAQVSPLWGAAGAVVGALGQVVTTAQAQPGPGALLYRLGCWTAAGGWLTWALSDAGTVWSTSGLASLAVGALAAGTLAPLGRIDAPPQDEPGTAVVLRGGGKIGLEWERRFRRVCRVAVTVTDVRPWDNGAGYDVHGQLPPGPATRRQIAAACEALATDARLPEGCGCEVKPGGNRGEFVLSVATINRLGEAVLPHPGDCSPRSILQPVAIGEYRDSAVAEVELREEAVFITGRRGGGKTNQLDVFTYGIVRCTDAVVWHIDLNGGGMSQPWLHPWLEGETSRPAIDWAASTPEEALLMVTVALAIAKDRKRSYRALKAQANSKLLPVSDRLPEIVIMVDEGAEALSPTTRDPITRQIRDGLMELQRIGRNEAVNVIISSLRPTQDMVAPAILKQSGIKIALFGLDEPDLGHLYNWQQGISMADLPTKGCAFLQTPETTLPRPMKAWLLLPEDIRAAAVTVADHRPELDPASAQIADAEHQIDLGTGRPTPMSDIYTGRYERMRAAFTGQDLPAIPDPAPAPDTTAPAALRVVGAAASWPDPIPTQRPTPAPARAADWPDPLPTTPTIQAAPAVPAKPQATPARGEVPELLRRALEAFDAAADTRMHSETLADALGMPDVWALADALGQYGVKPRKEKFVRGGKNRRGYERADIEQAAARHTTTAAAAG